MKIRHDFKSNRRLVYLVYGLTLLGLLLLFSASKGAVTKFEGIVIKQCAWVILGTVAYVFVRNIDYRNYRRMAFLLYLGILFCLWLVLVIGEGRAGRWIRIAWFNFQPAEFAKLVFIVAVSAYLSERDVRKAGVFLVSLIIAGLPALLILKQPNLGTAFIFLMIALGLLYQAGATRKQLLALLLVGILASPFLWFSLKPYQQERILTFLFPQRDPLGRGYNLLQSKITIGSGGLIGKGFLKGTQTKLAFLPEYHTDFIFCLLAEEFGLFGVVILLGLYYFFLQALLRIVSATRDRFGKLLATGVFVMFLSQIFINIGMALGLFPVAGIPLPFISYGGSFMIVALLSVAILVNIQEDTRLF